MTTPKLRFKEFDGDWSELKYKDVLTIKYGKDHKLLDEGNIPVYGTGGIMRHVNKYLYEGESILIGRKGTIDQPKYVNEKFWTVDTLFYTEIKQNAIPLFLFQHALQVNWLGLNEATGVPSLNTTSINNVDIGIPSKPEQTKIASFLSAVDEKISQLTQKHALLRQYKQGMMQKLFSQQIRFKADDGGEFGEWEEKKLGEVVTTIFGNPFDSKEMMEDDSGTPLMRGINIGERHIRHSIELDRFYMGDISRLTKYIVRSGDVVLSMDGSKVGRNAALVTDQDANSLLVQRVCILRYADKANIQYIYQWIISPIFHRYVDTVKTSSGIPHISGKQIQDFSIGYPCLEEQTKIAKFLSSIDQKLEVVAKQIEQAKTWKKGLLQQMFV